MEIIQSAMVEKKRRCVGGVRRSENGGWLSAEQNGPGDPVPQRVRARKEKGTGPNGSMVVFKYELGKWPLFYN